MRCTATRKSHPQLTLLYIVITTLENNLVSVVKSNIHIPYGPTTPNIFPRETLSLVQQNTVIIITNTLCLLCVRHCSKCFTFLNYITLHNNLRRQVLLLPPFYKSEKNLNRKLHNFLIVTPPMSGSQDLTQSGFRSSS